MTQRNYSKLREEAEELYVRSRCLGMTNDFGVDHTRARTVSEVIDEKLLTVINDFKWLNKNRFGINLNLNRV